MRGAYPTRFWDEGEILADRHDLVVPFDVPPGEYALYVGMYIPATGDRLPAATGGNAIRLTDVIVEAP